MARTSLGRNISLQKGNTGGKRAIGGVFKAATGKGKHGLVYIDQRYPNIRQARRGAKPGGADTCAKVDDMPRVPSGRAAAR